MLDEGKGGGMGGKGGRRGLCTLTMHIALQEKWPSNLGSSMTIAGVERMIQRAVPSSNREQVTRSRALAHARASPPHALTVVCPCAR